MMCGAQMRSHTNTNEPHTPIRGTRPKALREAARAKGYVNKLRRHSNHLSFSVWTAPSRTEPGPETERAVPLRNLCVCCVFVNDVMASRTLARCACAVSIDHRSVPTIPKRPNSHYYIDILCGRSVIMLRYCEYVSMKSLYVYVAYSWTKLIGLRRTIIQRHS